MDASVVGKGRGWFDHAGFGMFVHWDHASRQGLEVSWPMVGGIFALPEGQRVSVGQYLSSAAGFDPTEWDPAGLATAAAAAGMTYAVLTSRHHSGFSLWPTDASDHSSIASTPYGGDIVQGFVDAMRGAGLRVGLYLSLSDWQHPDYPAWRDEDKPYVFGASPPLPTDEQHERYVQYLKDQLEELLTRYGTIDLLWFDGGWERPVDWWRPHELEAHIRSFQPDVVLNDRLYGVGDYATPEQFVPATPPERKWETCLTMNHSWGYNPADVHYKSARELVHTLCEVAGRGGNLLLNVSPRGDGSLPPEQVERLEAMGGWMAGNADAVVGVSPGLEAWQFYGSSTRRGDRIYLHVLYRPYETVTVRNLPIKRVAAVTHLASGTPLRFTTKTGLVEQLGPDPDGEVTIYIPESLVDDLATVVAVDVTPS